LKVKDFSKLIIPYSKYYNKEITDMTLSFISESICQICSYINPDIEVYHHSIVSDGVNKWTERDILITLTRPLEEIDLSDLKRPTKTFSTLFKIGQGEAHEIISRLEGLNYFVECQTCRYRYPLYKGGYFPFSISYIEKIYIEKREQRRDGIILENKTKAELTQEVNFTNQYTQEIQLQISEEFKNRFNIKAGIDKLPIIEKTIESAIKETFVIREEKKETQSRTTSVKVPPNSSVKVFVIWNEIWQNVNVVSNNILNDEVIIPVSFLEKMDYDILIEDYNT
jgi:hypothetical protein